MALVTPPVVTGGLVTPMMSHASLVLGAGPLGTGLVGGSASLPPRKNAAISWYPSGPSWALRDL